MPRTCPVCKNLIQDDKQKFCSNCGAALTMIPVANAMQNSPSSQTTSDTTILNDADATVRRENSDATVRAQTSAYKEDTVLRPSSLYSANITSFKDYQIEKRLPTKGAEADIYIVSKSGEQKILKWYRPDITPKPDVFEQIRDLSREYRQFLVPIEEGGYDPETQRWYEIQEYCSSDLEKVLQEPGLTFNSERVKKIIEGIADAVAVLHNQGIVHRDLKPSNILVRSSEPLNLLLTDFGISSIMNSEVSMKATNLNAGTALYMAPESFTAYNGISYTGPAVDWWSLGVIICEILLGQHPFKGLRPEVIIFKLAQEGINLTSLDPRLQDYELLLKGLLTRNYQKRWNGEQVKLWLAGKRDIPVFYEQPVSERPHDKPYEFLGNNYYDIKELAAVFCQNEEFWNAGLKDFYRGWLASWLEGINHQDASRQVRDMAEQYERTQRDIGLVTLIYTFRNDLPFCYLGKEITLHNLLMYLGKAVRQDPKVSKAEQEIVKHASSGALYGAYSQYSRLTQKHDTVLASVLEFLQNEKSITKQHMALIICLSPEKYFWPPDVNIEDFSERLKFLRAVRYVHKKQDLEQEYVLTKELLNFLNHSDTYSKFGQRLKQNLVLKKNELQPYEMENYVIPQTDVKTNILKVSFH